MFQGSCRCRDNRFEMFGVSNESPIIKFVSLKTPNDCIIDPYPCSHTIRHRPRSGVRRRPQNLARDCGLKCVSREEPCRGDFSPLDVGEGGSTVAGEHQTSLLMLESRTRKARTCSVLMVWEAVMGRSETGSEAKGAFRRG